MKTDTLIFLAALGAVALLWKKAQSTSTSTGKGGEGGAPAWAATSGPMGAKYNPVTGTMEMAPLNVAY